MKKRTIGAVILLAILIGSIMIGYEAFGLVMLACAILGYFELINIKYDSKDKNLEMIRLIGCASLILLVLNETFFDFSNEVLFLVQMLGLTIPIVFYNDSNRYNIQDAFFVMGIIFFLGFAFHNIIYMASVDIYKCLFIFLMAFITDTYAFIGGMLVGRRPLTSISPKKTVEGSVIGAVMGVMVGTLYYSLAIGGLGLGATILVSLILTLLSEIGDLVFSSIKRQFLKKDFSNLIPGHGGIMERFDSVLLAAPIIYFLAKMFLQR